MLKHDAKRCMGCFSCMVACQQEHNLPAGIQPLVIGRSFREKPRLAYVFSMHVCRQCKRPSCQKACPEGAFFIRERAVAFDPGLCTGCGDCIAACANGCISLDPLLNRAVKCDTCLSRREQGLPPACLQACPVGALDLPAAQ